MGRPEIDTALQELLQKKNYQLAAGGFQPAAASKFEVRIKLEAAG
jgi:hypothetical protein